MVVALFLWLTLALMATYAACGEDDYPGLHVVENELVDGEGRSVRLLGVNRSGAEYACVEGHGFFAGPTDRRAVAAMTAWRINAVRVPLNEHCWLGINGAPSGYSPARYRKAIKAYVRRLHRAGLYAVLDLHWNAPGRAPAARQQPMADLDHAPRFWRSVARAFKEDHALGRAAGMQTLVDAVRSTGATQPVIATGIKWGTDLSSWLVHRPDDPEDQLAAGLHLYDFSSCTSSRCWRRTVEPVAREVPVVVSEVGERECSGAFLERFMSWADGVGVSYLAWSWNPSGCGAPALIESWDGRPTRSGDRVREQLIALDPVRLP
jgi:endoglucanase